jgi:hypothetical protein
MQGYLMMTSDLTCVKRPLVFHFNKVTCGVILVGLVLIALFGWLSSKALYNTKLLSQQIVYAIMLVLEFAIALAYPITFYKFYA